MTIRWVALLLAALVLTACGSAPPAAQHIDLSHTVTLPAELQPEGGEPLRVAIAAVISPKETLVHYQELLEYIGRKLDRPVRLMQRSTYAEVNELLLTGDVDLAFVCTWAYVDGQTQFGMELLAAPQVNGEAQYYSYLIVPAGSQAQTIHDLQGKTFAFTDPLSTTGRLVPVYWLNQEGLKPETFFKQTMFTYSHDRAIMAVADGLVDGAAVDHLVYEAMVGRDPDLGKRMRVIRRSEPIGTPPVAVGPEMDPMLKAQIRQLFLQMNEVPEGQRILQDLQIDTWVVPHDSAYDPIRRMLRAIGRP